MNACYLIDFILEIYRCLLRNNSQEWAHVRTKNVGMMCHTEIILHCQAIRKKNKYNIEANLVTSFLVGTVRCLHCFISSEQKN